MNILKQFIVIILANELRPLEHYFFVHVYPAVSHFIPWVGWAEWSAARSVRKLSGNVNKRNLPLIVTPRATPRHVRYYCRLSLCVYLCLSSQRLHAPRRPRSPRPAPPYVV